MMTTAPTGTTEKIRLFGLCMNPCDVLFFRDGRPFTAASYGESGTPTPQTLAGALCTRLLEHAGCDATGFRNLGRLVASGKDLASAADEICGAGWISQIRVRGPWFCRAGQDGQPLSDVFTPVPANLRQTKSNRPQDRRIVRFDPLAKGLSLPGWTAPIPTMRALWSKEHVATERTSGYLTRKGLTTFLEGGVPEVSDDHLLPSDEIFGYDRRTGIGVEVDRYTAEKGLIYGVRFLALKPSMALYAEIALPAAAPTTIFSGQQSLPFGGEGRRVVVQMVEPFHWPKAKPGSGQGTLVLLTTPGLFDSTRPGQRWKPACLNDYSPLRGAAVASLQPVSGWNLATGGPKPNRFAVPAGSVYFLQGAAEDLPSDSLADSPEDRLQGWGCFARGVWSDV
jgi:CRISPR-associated protein Cmr3